jgi:hypothetical protein
MAELTNGKLRDTLGMAVSVIGSEHFMSAGLSSPWSTAKFAISDKDKEEVWHYFNEAAYASMTFGVVVSYMLKSWYPLVSSGLTLAYYHRLYKDALSRTPVENPTPVLFDDNDNTNNKSEMLSLLPSTLDENGNYCPLSNEELESIKNFDPNVSNYSYIKWNR